MSSGELEYDLPEGYEVRRAVMSDLEGITSVYQSAYPDDTDYALVFEQNVEAMLEDDDAEYYVVEDQEGDIHATAANLYNSLNEGNVQPGRLAVAEDARGKGFGKALLVERTRDLLERDVDGIAFSGGATSHTASQGNLSGRGYEVFGVDRQVNESYFGNSRETEIMFIHPETIENDDRTVYLPEEYTGIAEINLSKVSDDLAGREIVETETDVDTGKEYGFNHVSFLSEIDSTGGDLTAEQVVERLEENKEEEEHLMVPIDANSRSTVPLYRMLQDRDFELEGFAPDWFTREGENRDALIMQYSPQEPETVEVIDPVKQLMEDIEAEFETIGRTEHGWKVNY